MKKLISILLTISMLCSINIAAMAAPVNTVEFNGNELVTEINNVNFAGLQPGDTASINIDTTNTSKTETEWYVSNEIIKSLETTTARAGNMDGAYKYTLKYDGTTIYDSTVGGDGQNGLNGVNDTLGTDFVHLGKLAPNETKTLTLDITYDGKTIDNNYQDKQSIVNLNFAVEVNETRTIITTNKVQTGNDSNLWLYQTMAIVAVTGILAILITTKKEKRGNS